MKENTDKNKKHSAANHSRALSSGCTDTYRTDSNRYLWLFSEIDKMLEKGRVILAIEGGSASGKTTLAQIVSESYDCNVFHMDDFFLRPEQRTRARFSEVGGNVDRERFYDEVLTPLLKNETVTYRRFDCGTQTLGEPIVVAPKQLTVIEGVYSMHPAFEEYYNLSLFLDIDSECQRERILRRNTPKLATRFFEEWIPLENIYFAKANIKDRCTHTVAVNAGFK